MQSPLWYRLAWLLGVLSALANLRPAWADEVAPLPEVKTVQYTMVGETKGPPARTFTTKTLVLDAQRSRLEMGPPNDLVQITDEGRRKRVSLDPQTKQATVWEYDDTASVGGEDPATWLHLLQKARDNKDGQCEQLGEKEIEGHHAVGFRLPLEGGQVIELWGDTQTGLPMRVEMVGGMDGHRKITLCEFVFNAELDETLFSVEVPAGYTVTTEKAKSGSPDEQSLIEALRAYQQWTGEFPEALNSEISLVFKAKATIRQIWEGIGVADCEASAQLKHQFEEKMLRVMTALQENILQGECGPKEEEEFDEQWNKIVQEILYPVFGRDSSEVLREYLQRTAEGADWQISAVLWRRACFQMMWDDLALGDRPAHPEASRQFEARILSLVNRLAQESTTAQEPGELFVEQFCQIAAETRRQTTGVDVTAFAEDFGQETEEERQARSQGVMEAQEAISWGVQFADFLSPDADAHYVGRDVSPEAADTAIFWYRPAEAKNYRVIYADLSVRDADAPPQVPEP